MNGYGLDPVCWFAVHDFACNAMFKCVAVSADVVDQGMSEIKASLRHSMAQTRENVEEHSTYMEYGYGERSVKF